MAGFTSAKTLAPMPYAKQDDPLQPGGTNPSFGNQMLARPVYDPNQDNHPWMRGLSSAINLGSLGAIAGLVAGRGAAPLGIAGALGGGLIGMGMNRKAVQANQAAQQRQINSVQGNNIQFMNQQTGVQDALSAYKKMVLNNDPDYQIQDVLHDTDMDSVNAHAAQIRADIDAAQKHIGEYQTRAKGSQEMGDKPNYEMAQNQPVDWENPNYPEGYTGPRQIPGATDGLNYYGTPKPQRQMDPGYIPQTDFRQYPPPPKPRPHIDPSKLGPRFEAGVRMGPQASRPFYDSTRPGVPQYDIAEIRQDRDTGIRTAKLPSEIAENAQKTRTSRQQEIQTNIDNTTRDQKNRTDIQTNRAQGRMYDRLPAAGKMSATEAIMAQRMSKWEELHKNGQITDYDYDGVISDPSHAATMTIYPKGAFTKRRIIKGKDGTLYSVPPMKQPAYQPSRASKGRMAPDPVGELAGDDY